MCRFRGVDVQRTVSGKSVVLLIHSVQVQQYSREFEGLKEGRSVPKTLLIFKLSPFVEEDGLSRVQGCLQFSELSEAEKFPIVMANIGTVLWLVMLMSL